jgi:hypothetical protein
MERRLTARVDRLPANAGISVGGSGLRLAAEQRGDQPGDAIEERRLGVTPHVDNSLN